MTAIYRENYSGAVRGQVFGVTMFAAVAAGLVVQGAGGGLLEFDLRWYRGVFTGLALVAALSGYCVLRIPDLGEREPARPNPLTSFGAVLENPRFGFVLVAWFLFGFANLALQPQRIEYLSQPKYGIELSPGMVVLVATFTTEATRLVVVPIFARLFDRVNFMYLRMSLNSFCLAYIIIYYNTTSLPLLMLASAFLGLMFGGGAIAWNLWVTKFAPPSETARYMSVHTFLNGVRGTIAPLVGYIVVEYLSIRVTSWIAAGLVTASLVVLWRIRAPRQTPASE
jgi:predicted MFS family arabinose efflux permease